MNTQHLIDHAVFDTSYSENAMAFNRRSEIDEFIKIDLMNVIDEVFDRIDRESGNPDAVFRIDKLEIDLGDIPCRAFRQQMPRKLREQLLLALRELRYRATEKPLSSRDLVDGKSDLRAQLFCFLRHGYLPWYSRLTDANALEALLIETVDSTPAALIECMRDHVHRARVLERLAKQFSKPTVQRIAETLSSPVTREDDRTGNVRDLEAQLVLALLAGDAVHIERAWQTCYVEHPQLLEKVLRQYGQRAIVRKNILSSFSPVLFEQLLRLLAPAAHEFVQMFIDHADILLSVDKQDTTARSRQTNELGAFTLAYLLVGPGGRFSRRSYLASLLRHMSASDDRSHSLLLARLMENTGKLFASEKDAGDMQRLLAGLAVEMTAREAEDEDSWLNEAEHPATPDDRYQRLMSTLTLAGPGRAYSDSCLLQDIRMLTRDAPDLLMRLYRELQTGRHPWRLAVESLSAPVLAELCYAFLSSNKPTDPAISSDPGSDLISAVHSNAGKSHDRRAFFTHILSCLVKDEVIDFSAIKSGAAYGLEPAATPGDRAHPVHKADRSLDNAAGPVATDDIDPGVADQGEDEEPAPLENIYIANAGAVLFAPYLPRLFERLGLVNRGEFKNRDAAEHGVHCVQFLVDESISSPEYQLVLNKLLCGIRPGLPIRRSIELAAGEQEQLEALLHAITQHWKPLANTSIAGLRESFLQRNGRLQRKDDAWHLSVEARPYDMLLDQVPWSFSTIRFPWMERVIYVEWR